jgi:hypothetical protein
MKFFFRAASMLDRKYQRWIFALLPCWNFKRDDVFSDEKYYTTEIVWLFWFVRLGVTIKKKGGEL